MPITFFSVNGAGAGGGPSTVNTANGISGNGSLAMPVILGGNPLNQNTTISLLGFFLSILSAQGNVQISNTEFQVSYENVGVAQGIITVTPTFINTAVLDEVTNNETTSNQNKDQILLQGQDIVANKLTIVSTGVSAGVHTSGIAYVNLGTGAAKQLATNDVAATGILVDDSVDNIGLRGNGGHVFPKIGGPGQYAQYGNILNQNIASVNVPGVNSTQSLTYLVGVTYEFLRVNPWAFFRSGAGSVVLTIAYVDNAGGAHTITLPAFNLGVTVQNINPYIIQAQAGSNVVITWTVAGVAIYDQIATIEKML